MGSEKDVSSKQRRLEGRVNLCCCPSGADKAEAAADAVDCCGPLTVKISVAPVKGCCDDNADCCPAKEQS